MKVYAPDAKSWVPCLGRPITAGEAVDVDDDLAAALLEQGWKQPKQKPASSKSNAPTEAPSEEPRA